jgi:hypothetical protein
VTRTAAGTAWYAYAVVGPVTEELRNALGDELELVEADGLGVVVSQVPLSEFGEDVLPSRLNDRAWLEEKARVHESVLQRLLAVASVVPLRFGSIHRDRTAVERFLVAGRDPFAATLDRLRGRVELGVKVWGGAPERDEPAARPATGREYLEQRKAARERAAVAATKLDDRLREIHRRLLGVAEDGVLNRPQPRELTGADREMLVNAAYLVEAGDDRLVSEVARLRDANPDLAFEVTGPWAPYNFVDTGADE